MTPKHLRILLLAVVAAGLVSGQSEDIPIENDNQYPPDKHAESESAIIEGSGDGTIEEPPATTVESTPTPQIEEIQKVSLTNTILAAPVHTEPEQLCPKPCVCHFEGGTDNFVVDCSGIGLTEFPSPIDPKTTTLNVQNNKLTEIPKEVSALKNLKVLNAANNLIMSLASGSISELPELTILKLSNNRLIEYPQDLKNSFTLTKLEELDLGGNDMRTTLAPETFSIFSSLRILTLPTSTEDLLHDICGALKNSLETVCTETCTSQPFDCPDAPTDVGEDLIDTPVLPGMLAFPEDNNDPFVSSTTTTKESVQNSGTENTLSSQSESNDNAAKAETTVVPSVSTETTSANGKISLRTAIVGKEVEEATPAKSNSIVDKEVPNKGEPEVQTGATTSDSKSGGVDKSVIGIIVAGMVVVVAGITIKKNWSSIKKRFSSTPRSPNERGGANANGTAPEEVPLQEKSPV